MKIIDAHIHFMPEDKYLTQTAIASGQQNTAEFLRGEYEKYGVVRAVVMGNRPIDDVNQTYPDFASYCVGISGGYAKDPKPWLVEEHLKRKNCVGIKIYLGYNHTYIYDDAYLPLFELAEKYDKPAAAHTGSTANGMGFLKYCHPLTFDEVAPKFPKTRFVMCHIGNPWIVDAVAVMGNNPNVSADISGLLEGGAKSDSFFEEQKGYLEHIKTWLQYLNAYDRLMYGTDWPLPDIGSYIEFVKRIIPKEHYEKVFFENAKRIYRLDV